MLPLTSLHINRKCHFLYACDTELVSKADVHYYVLVDDAYTGSLCLEQVLTYS
jgi:hypothetical protein